MILRRQSHESALSSVVWLDAMVFHLTAYTNRRVTSSADAVCCPRNWVLC